MQNARIFALCALLISASAFAESNDSAIIYQVTNRGKPDQITFVPGNQSTVEGLYQDELRSRGIPSTPGRSVARIKDCGKGWLAVANGWDHNNPDSFVGGWACNQASKSDALRLAYSECQRVHGSSCLQMDKTYVDYIYLGTTEDQYAACMLVNGKNPDAKRPQCNIN